jgi:hypothetical protein
MKHYKLFFFLIKMLLLNACSTQKIIFNDSEEFRLFSLVPNPPKDMQMHNFGDIIVCAKTAAFLRAHAIQWVRSEDMTRVLGVKVDAEESACREILQSILSCHDKKFFEHQ